ncbi:MAG: hypothetical protein R2731_11460 [Nocardioides sp.]
MSARVVLHIGTMKSGTSFIQSVLGANQRELAAQGCVFLGGRFGAQSRAVRDIYRLPAQPRRNRRRWARLAAQARELDAGAALVSMEFLSFAGDAAVAEFLEPLEGLDVRVVLTVRDQFRAIPAQWQTYTRNFGTDAWPAYLRAIQAPRLRGTRPSRAYSTFHRAQDVVPMLQRWGHAAGVSGLDVVTVPGPGAPRDELWRRFAAVAGVPQGVVDLERSRDNPSLGFASCDYLRRLNTHLADVAPRRYRRRSARWPRRCSSACARRKAVPSWTRARRRTPAS